MKKHIQQFTEVVEIAIIEEVFIDFLSIEAKSSDSKEQKAIAFHQQSKIIK